MTKLKFKSNMKSNTKMKKLHKIEFKLLDDGFGSFANAEWAEWGKYETEQQMIEACEKCTKKDHNLFSFRMISPK